MEAGFASYVGPPAAADELSKNIWWKNIRYRDSPGGPVTSNETLDRSFGNGVSWAVTSAGADSGFFAFFACADAASLRQKSTFVAGDWTVPGP